MTFSSQVILSIFFLYVVIVSEKLFSIISCSLQKTVENSRTFKHMFIFLNIFLFTFILGWYTEKSIHSAKISYNNDEDNIESFSVDNKYDFFNLYKEEFSILGKYLLYSFIIYLIFLLTTKCETKFLLVFFILIIILFIFFLLRTYSKNPKYYKFEK